MDGVPSIPIIIGALAFSELFKLIDVQYISEEAKTKKRSIKGIIRGVLLSFTQPVNLIRSTLLGLVIGALPAAGGSVATFVSYNEAKRFAKNPETFGKGNIGGVIASESANNAVLGGALITAFDEGLIAGAATDVTEPEPLPHNSPLWDAKNLLVTPHQAATGDGVPDRMQQLINDNVLAFMQERPLRNVVSLE